MQKKSEQKMKQNLSVKICGSWKPFKNDEKCYLFHVKALFVLLFVMLNSILVAKVLTPPPRTLSGLHTINHGALKTSANFLPMWNIFFPFLWQSFSTSLKNKSILSTTRGRCRNPLCKKVFFVTIVNTLNVYTVSHFE